MVLIAILINAELSKQLGIATQEYVLYINIQ
jgi:hypothetical protein